MNKKTKAKPISGEQTLNDLKCRAEDGDSQSQFDLGMYYATAGLKPSSTPTFETMCRAETCISMKKTLEWWLKSAEQGHIRALQGVIKCYKFELGVCQDEKEFGRIEKWGFENVKKHLYPKSLSVAGDNRLLFFEHS